MKLEEIMEAKLPRWDGRMLIAAIFILGYYALIFRVSGRNLPPANVALIRDGMVVLGPPIGAIVAAIFRTTVSDERREALQASTVSAALETPGRQLALPAPQAMEDAVERGARDGTADGLASAVGVSHPQDREAPPASFRGGYAGPAGDLGPPPKRPAGDDTETEILE